jgi:hypothetical protein
LGQRVVVAFTAIAAGTTLIKDAQIRQHEKNEAAVQFKRNRMGFAAPAGNTVVACVAYSIFNVVRHSQRNFTPIILQVFQNLRLRRRKLKNKTF